MENSYYAIGETAGKIYRYLEANSSAPVSLLEREVDIPDTQLVHQALGWLAREGKIEFKKSGKGVKVSLIPTKV